MSEKTISDRAEEAVLTDTRTHGTRRVRKRRRQVFVRTGQIVIGIAAVVAWELLTRAKVIDPFFVAQPTAIAERIWQWLASGSVYDDLGITLAEAALSLVVGGALGLLTGLVLARSELLAQIVDPYIKVANAMPRLVLAPLFLLWFGLGIWSKVAMGVTLVVFIVFFNTFEGIRSVEPVLVSNSRMLGASESQLLRNVFLPNALTWIFASLHISVGFAIVGAVVGEYLGASRGMGYIIAQAQGTFDTVGVFAGLVVLAVVVGLVDMLVHRVERYLLRWRQT